MEKDGKSFLLINFYNANAEPEQIKTLVKLLSHIRLPNIDEQCQNGCTDDFNSFFDYQLEPGSGNRNFESKLKF